VLLDERYGICDTFVSYVHPQYGTVDPFIEELTGITREDVRRAPNAEQVLKAFSDWFPEGAYPVSWSGSDLLQLKKEMAGKKIRNEKLERCFKNWIDCQKEFSEVMETSRQYKLSEALIIADVDWAEGEHDALVDAKNTALLFAKMEQSPDFEVSAYYASSSEGPATYSPFADLMAHFDDVAAG